MLQWACSAFATEADVLNAPGGCPFEEADDVEAYIDMASDVMFQLTGGRVHGVCTATVYPITDRNCWDIGDFRRQSWWTDGWLGGTIIHSGPEMADRFGGHTPVHLAGPNPVVLAVVIDGVALAPTDWMMAFGCYLIRRQGSWPTINNITQPSGSGTWSITYRYGDAPDLLTRDACVELAIDMAKTSGIGGSRGFGPGVVAANVQGVQLSIEELTQAYGQGAQMVPALDRFLGIYARGGPEQGDVYSPDLDAYQLVDLQFFP